MEVGTFAAPGLAASQEAVVPVQPARPTAMEGAVVQTRNWGVPGVVEKQEAAAELIGSIDPDAGLAARGGVVPALIAPSDSTAAARPGQFITAAINERFNSAFDWLASLPSSPLTNLAEGALVLIRRSLFFIPTGVSASQIGTQLSIDVNAGSVAYFRQDGTTLQVSDVPLYCGSQDFAANTVTEVVAKGNPGNRGSAGLYFTAGIVDSDLTVSGIESLTFADTSAFTGTVEASVGSGVLSVSGGVRGWAGVTLDGAVRLRTDVDVDARNGDATFTSTVDAAVTGSQSLTVTASGVTTFASAVGGYAALAALSTRGITPLQVVQSADSQTIPLHFVQAQSLADGQWHSTVRYGIDVAIGDNPSRMYMFDTGAPGLFAGYDSAVWQQVPLGTERVAISYGSGMQLDGVAADATLTLGQGPHTVSTGQPVQIAAVLRGASSSLPNSPAYDFTDPARPPIEGAFFGDFGADLEVMMVAGQPTLTSPLFQLPGNLSTGFLVQLGPIGGDPRLTVGVTDELRAQFPYAIPFTATGPLFPVSGYPSAVQYAFNGQYTVSGPDGTSPLGTQVLPDCTEQCLPSLIDSGAPTASARPGMPYPYAEDPDARYTRLRPGTTFSGTFPTTEGRDPLTWTFVAGTSPPAQVNYEPSPSDTINVGLTLYNDFNVMFDVEKQVIWLRPTGAQATVALNSVTTTGPQSYAQSAHLAGTYLTDGGAFTVGGPSTLTADSVIEAGRGGVTFYGPVDGWHELRVNADGATAFVREVGSAVPLQALITDAGGTTSTFGVATIGDQSYGDGVTLSNDYSAQDGRFSAARSATLAGPTVVSAKEGISFDAGIDSLAGKGFPLTLQSYGGDVLFGGSIGAADPLGGLVIEAEGDAPIRAVSSSQINLDGGLTYSNATRAAGGLSVGHHVTVEFTGGGLIQRFAGSGVLFTGPSTDSELRKFVINSNAGDGIELATDGAVTGLLVTSCSISDNGGNGISISGSESFGNAILSNSIAVLDVETTRGIALNKGANRNQPAPRDITAQRLATGVVNVRGVAVAADGYSGDLRVQIFGSAPVAVGDPVGSQGQYLLGEVVVPPGAFRFDFDSAAWPDDLSISATATPVTGEPNTSEFTEAVR